MKSCWMAAALALVAGGLAACTPAGALIGGTAVVARSVVQERSTFDALTDVEIELSISTRLAQHSGELFRDVSVDVVESRVVLTGSVPQREDRVAASEIAWQAPGVRSVENALEVAEDSGTLAYIADAGISNRLRFEYLRDTGVDAADFNVETVDGVVHLTGLAASRGELDRAIALARSIDGVKRVVSHVLLIDDPRRKLAGRAPDAAADGGTQRFDAIDTAPVTSPVSAPATASPVSASDLAPPA